jgi:hypothetical protein
MTKGAKLFLVLFCFALFCSVNSRSAKADEWDKKTILSFSGPVQVQNTRLEAGTYVFKLADTADRHVVQIFNQEETQVIATIMAIPDYRLEPTGKTAIKFSETSEGATTSGTVPEAGVPIKEWFYPGDNFGQEFKVVPLPVEMATAEPAAPPPAESEPAPAPAPQRTRARPQNQPNSRRRKRRLRRQDSSRHQSHSRLRQRRPKPKHPRAYPRRLARCP